jgi:FKBP-type peptidyl-prolyl cis-trans isomerase
LSEEESMQVKQEFMNKVMGSLAEKNKSEGEAFLKANADKDGVKITASGLQYQVIKEGEGQKPKAEETVKVHYAGTLLDGTEFDSSYKRGEPTTFPLNRVIRGWTEGLQLMTVGSKYRFFIPSNLAYGPQGAGQQIGPNSTLIFDVELLAIEK